jgi:CO/xanthine dehydrogenase Mo-binding subunit
MTFPGHGADCSLGRVEISPDGRISIHSDAVEIGNGIGTALANRVAFHIGGIADEVTVAPVDAFDELELYKSGDAYTITQAAQDEAAKNPRWVPEISSATSASIGAHVGTQAAAEAARIVFRLDYGPRRSRFGALRQKIREQSSRMKPIGRARR